MIRNIKTPRKGQQLKSKELARMARTVEQLAKSRMHTGLLIGLEGVGTSAAGGSLRNNLYVPFFAKLTGKDTSIPIRYAFTEMMEDLSTPTDGDFDTAKTDGRTGTLSPEQYPAYSANQLDHQLGTIVLMWLAPEADHYLFVDPSLHVVDDQNRTVSTTLNGAINASVTSITITDCSHLPTGNKYVLLCESEKILVGAGFGTTTLTSCIRGWDGTTAASHADTTAISLVKPDYAKGVNKLTFDRLGFAYPGTVSETGPGGVQEAIHLEVTQTVEVTSTTTTTIDSIALYPGQRKYFDPASGFGSSQETIWIYDVNGSTLTTGKYLGRLVGYASTSGGNTYAVYVVQKVGGSSTGSSDADRGAKAYHSTTQTVTAGNAAALNADSKEYDTDTIHDNVTNNTRLSFTTLGTGRMVVSWKCNADVTFAGADVVPEWFEVFCKLNGASEVTGSRMCAAFWRITSIPNSTATSGTSVEMDHVCMNGTFMVNITSTSDYIEMFGDATANTLNVTVDKFMFSCHKLNRAANTP